MTKKGQSGIARAGLALWLCWLLAPLEASGTVREDSSVETAEWLEMSAPGTDRIRRERSEGRLGNPGSLLREARMAADAQDRSHAIWVLEQVIQRHPVVADHAALLQIQWMQEDGHFDWVVGVAQRALARNPATPLAPEFYAALGDALMKQGDGQAAQVAWRHALDESDEDGLRARVLLAIGAAEERAGMDEEAATTYRLLWYAYPTLPEAAVAAHRLELLAVLLERRLLDGTAWRRRADRLYRKRRNEEAFEAYAEALKLGVSASETRAVARQKARLLFRLRRYPEAVVAFQALPQQDDVPIWYARSLARAGRVPESIEAFERLAKTGPASLAPRARFLAATLLEGRDFDERARTHYLQLTKRGRRSGFTDAALWRLGWMAYKEDKDLEAVG
ncbi:MAG: tetratricopeptide repeat protein, partial [Myxococcota bacterium]|nr:tetratricopeptide repeat protein [Myxococcota bacterium]